MPDFVVRIPSSFVPQMRMLTRDLGRVNRASAEKARRVLGFSPRPVANPIVDCGESLSVSHRGIG